MSMRIVKLFFLRFVSFVSYFSTIDEVKAKIQLLEALNDIAIGIKALKKEIKEEENDESLEISNPLDIQYEKLDIKLEPLEHKGKDFTLIEKYIKSTHGKTHHLKFDVEEIFICQKDSLGKQIVLWNISCSNIEFWTLLFFLCLFY